MAIANCESLYDSELAKARAARILARLAIGKNTIDLCEFLPPFAKMAEVKCDMGYEWDAAERSAQLKAQRNLR